MEEGHIGLVISIFLWIWVVILSCSIIADIASLFPPKNYSDEEEEDIPEEMVCPLYEGRKAEEIHYRLCESEKLRNNPKYHVFCLYLHRDTGMWCVVDNSNGDMITEFLKTKKEAEKWLYGN